MHDIYQIFNLLINFNRNRNGYYSHEKRRHFNSYQQN